MLKCFDYQCETCGHQRLDVLMEQDRTTRPCDREGCAGTMVRVWLPNTHGATVIGDEIDVTIKNGLCNEDGTPRRFRSRTELRAAERERGLSNHVVHIGTKGGDKSKHTTRWI